MSCETDRMPCSITDGPQYDDEPYTRTEQSYDEWRQEQIDDEHAKRVTDDLVKALPDIMLFREQAE